MKNFRFAISVKLVMANRLVLYISVSGTPMTNAMKTKSGYKNIIKIKKKILLWFQRENKDRYWPSPRSPMLRETISYNDEIADKFWAKPSMMKHPALAPRLVSNVTGHLNYPCCRCKQDFKIELYFCYLNLQ